MKIIAKIKTDFPTKFGIPRQSGIVSELKADIIFEPEYRHPDAVRGLEEFSHIWLIWNFSESESVENALTVRPPRLGGNIRKGVFATRSPFRPNPIGLSCVKLESIEFSESLGPILHVSGADLMNGTPIFDIKPYIPYADCHPEASGGFSKKSDYHKLSVEISNEFLPLVPKDKLDALIGVLEQDPRPAYQNDPDRIYGFEFAEMEIRFSVNGDKLTVRELTAL
jgi:tRNA-Thr(GGU) m(6)t(6)A37 methyltransferase TsaA